MEMTCEEYSLKKINKFKKYEKNNHRNNKET